VLRKKNRAKVQQFLDIQLNWVFRKERYNIFQMLRYEIFKIDTDRYFILNV